MPNIFTELESKVHALWTKLVADSHPAADDAKVILDEVKTAAETDAGEVVKAAEPVVAEAVKDGEAIVEKAAETAVADAPAVIADAEKAV